TDPEYTTHGETRKVPRLPAAYCHADRRCGAVGAPVCEPLHQIPVLKERQARTPVPRRRLKLRSCGTGLLACLGLFPHPDAGSSGRLRTREGGALARTG